MNQSIKGKLLIGFSVLIILLAGVSVLMSGKLSEANERLGNTVELSAKKVTISQQILIHVLDAARHEKNLILEDDPVQLDYYRNRIASAVAAADKQVPLLQDLVDEKGALVLNEFKTSWTAYRSTMDKIISLSMKNQDEQAFRLSIEEGLKTRDEAIAILERLVTKNEQNMADDKKISDENYRSSVNLIIGIIIAGLVLAMVVAYWIITGITRRISFISREAEKIASREYTMEKLADPVKDELRPAFNSLVNINDSFREVTENANIVASGNLEVDLVPRSEKDTLGHALKQMTLSLRRTTAENKRHIWLTAGQNQLNEKLRGDQSIEELATSTITFLSNYLEANIGAVYLFDDEGKRLTLKGRYAFSSNGERDMEFSPGQGLIGQAAREKKLISLTDIKEEHVRIVSTVLEAKPRHLLIAPFMFEGKTLGVIEIGRLTGFSETEREFVNSAMESIGISINSALARKRIQLLLEETQVQSEELQSQQEELKQVNEELEEQAQNLKQQQEELQITNEELEEQTQALEMKNKEIENARYDIEQKTKQLETSSRYKSEFLANMSHELRTPLNSLLILSRDLSENKTRNLTGEQVESAEIIYKSGHDLLSLINEVLDLSKIEAGKMTLNVERVPLKSLADELYKTFRLHAGSKGLKFVVNVDGRLTEFIRTDSQRLHQILKNLLSNAFKFTEKGQVKVDILEQDHQSVAFAVTDTGIGIAEDKQLAIFEAFQQAEGGTSRKYGGTGLGLSISRELAKLLGGEIRLKSKPGEGSVFTLVIPKETSAREVSGKHAGTAVFDHGIKSDAKHSGFFNYPSIDDDRNTLGPDDKIVLIVEDDQKFAGILFKQAHQKGFKCLAASTGEDGLMLAEKYIPHAIILDLVLPGIDGHKVLAEVKSRPSIRHIPVHVISAEERTLEPIREGAVEYLNKPVDKKQLDEAFNRIENFISRKVKNLLMVEDDENSRKAMRKLIGNGDVQCFEAGTAAEALKIFGETHIDCIVLDIGLPDMSGFDLIRKFEKMKSQVPPIIVYTGKELTKEENRELEEYAESIIIKGVKSEERLLDETALFLHRTITNLPESKQKMIANLYDAETVFKGKKILLVDDDMRNVFALSKILKERGMEVIKAENGINALEVMNRESGIDLVLMDIMMPEMDGYEAMRRIREQERFKRLPVIALTAKAMKEDKQKCIDAGANDYITKPVDVDRLLSLMRVWLGK